MRLKLDENMPRLARDRLELEKWDVHDVHDEGLSSATDEQIQRVCEREHRVLVTLDTDFADTRRYDPAKSPGVVVLRPANQSVGSILQCLNAAIRALSMEPVTGALWIVEPERLRIRNHPTGA